MNEHDSFTSKTGDRLDRRNRIIFTIEMILMLLIVMTLLLGIIFDTDGDKRALILIPQNLEALR